MFFRDDHHFFFIFRWMITTLAQKQKIYLSILSLFVTELGVLNRQASTGPVTDRGSEIIYIGSGSIFTPSVQADRARSNFHTTGSDFGHMGSVTGLGLIFTPSL
jgi:hypothetical protein